MIYFVDEDVLQVRPYSSELEIRGFEVESLDNADDAYDQLAAASNVQLVVLDVMLATRESGTSRFTRTITQDFLTTGLNLIEELSSKRPDIVPFKVVIFSMATTAAIVTQIEKVARDRKIPYLRKADYPSPFRFGEIIEKIVRGEAG